MKKPSKPSSTPSLQSGQRRSTISWTIPEPADVISYAYLWAREAATGQEEGLKDRPVVVVVAQATDERGTYLLVAPVTHSPSAREADAVEIPQSVKKHLDLDRERSWIVVDELNRFRWPGPDIRPVPGGDGSPLYGAIPDWLFERMKRAILGGRFRITKRSE